MVKLFSRRKKVEDGLISQAEKEKMFENLAQIRHASRQELVDYLEYWGTACYDDEPTSLLREAAIDTFKTEGC